jgi:hypothetical protein
MMDGWMDGWSSIPLGYTNNTIDIIIYSCGWIDGFE